MAKEIEKKYLITRGRMNLEEFISKFEVSVTGITQTYLEVTEENEIRIRRENSAYCGIKTTLTTKSGKGLTREEYEAEIPEAMYNDLWRLGGGNCSITKVRHTCMYQGMRLEFDFYLPDEGFLKDLVVLEVEFASEEEALAMASSIETMVFVEKDVTTDEQYKNKNLWLRLNADLQEV